MDGYSKNYADCYKIKECEATKYRKDLITNLPMEHRIDCLFAWIMSQRSNSEIINLYNAYMMYTMLM